MTIDIKFLNAAAKDAAKNAVTLFSAIGAKVEEYVAGFPPEERAAARLRALCMVLQEVETQMVPRLLAPETPDPEEKP